MGVWRQVGVEAGEYGSRWVWKQVDVEAGGCGDEIRTLTVCHAVMQDLWMIET